MLNVEINVCSVLYTPRRGCNTLWLANVSNTFLWRQCTNSSYYWQFNSL